MTLIIEKPTTFVDKKPDDYHIKIVNAKRRMQTEKGCREKIDGFLADLFDFEGSRSEESELEDAPLEFSKHSFNSEASTNVLLVELRLTDQAREANLSLDEAAERFCQLVFSSRAKGILETLTPLGLLGISALSGPFEQYWTQTFFRDYMVHGPRLLRTIDSTFQNNSYLPEWALTLSFAVVADLDLRAFVSESLSTMDSFSTDSITLGSSILEKYTRGNREQEKKWKDCHAKFIRSVDAVSSQLHEATSPEMIGLSDYNHQLHKHKDLCNSLYEATLEAAKTITSNKEIFKAFVEQRNNAVLTTAGSGLVAAAALTKLGSFVTTSTALPLGSWTLAEFGSFVTGGGVPLVYSTEYCIAPWPVAAAAAVAVGASAYVGVISYGSILDKQKQMDYHKQMNTIITRAWTITHEIHTLLRWIHLTDASEPSSLNFVDDDSRSEWARFIQSIKAVSDDKVTKEDLGPRMVLTYLTEQSKSLDKLRAQLIKLD